MPFIASALLMWVLLYLIFPYYRYYIDPDGTAYLTIARRYAAGNYVQAINGYWSPWSCWLTALLIRAGAAAIPASVVVNTAGATGFLYISQSIFLKFNMERRLQWLLNGAETIFLCYAIFAQSFDDLWECFFLLSCLRLLLSESFMQKDTLQTAYGMLGGLAYFAKAYSFPFFMLNTVCCTYLLADDKKQWIKVSASTIITMLIVSFPWIYALHYKYGIWTTSTAGPLNTSWYLVGHPFWRDGIAQLLPPAYPDSPYYWEDPYAVNGDAPHFWSSWHLFGLQWLRVGVNLFKLLRSMLELSLFFPVVTLIVFVTLRKHLRKPGIFTKDIQLARLSFLLFPLGYILVNFESRYIWYMLPLCLVMTFLILKRNEAYVTRKINMQVAYWLLAISILLFPVWQLRAMYRVGEDDHEVAAQLRIRHIAGSFTSNALPGKQQQSVVRIAYFSGNPYYAIPYPEKITQKELLQEMRRYKVGYYYFLCKDSADYKFQLMDEEGKPFPSRQLYTPTVVKIFKVDSAISWY